MAEEQGGFFGKIGEAVSGAVDFADKQGRKLVGSIQETITPDTPEQGALKRNAQKNYQYEFINYPSNLGDVRHPYYITFFINIQDLSKFRKDSSGKSIVAVNAKNQPIQSTVAINQQGRPGLQKNFKGTNIGFGRKTSRTKTAIRLYMPDTLSWSYQNQFRDVSLSGHVLGKALGLASGGGSLIKSVMEGGLQGGLANLKSNETRGLAGEFGLGTLLGDTGQGLAAVGLALNPQIDVIYETPELRRFNFEFAFAPRSASEGRVVQKIIKSFKFHSAPEILSNGGQFGRYFVPPSDFDIEFSVNSMGKISTCVLENVTVDYGPTGSAFYPDGTPVHARLTLQFRELEFITKDLIEERGY
jgi:hypothetical protein